jgi:hypothetical protein
VLLPLGCVASAAVFSLVFGDSPGDMSLPGSLSGDMRVETLPYSPVGNAAADAVSLFPLPVAVEMMVWEGRRTCLGASSH